MSSSFFALIDDIAVLARAAAASIDDVAAGAAQASAKATGVVIDDAAVTPQYVQGVSPKRELPVVWRIAKGSLINKAVIIAAILPLSIFLPIALPWLLIIGGTYLAYEGAEKVWQWRRHHRDEKQLSELVPVRSEVDERQVVTAALRTDLVLSAEIMLISLGSLDADSWVIKLAILIVVAIAMTLGVYGVVGLLIKFDDIGLWLTRQRLAASKKIGVILIKSMPVAFNVLTVIGVIAMLWIGGQILIENLAEIGWATPHHYMHTLIGNIPGPPITSWVGTTLLSALTGLLWGSLFLWCWISIKSAFWRVVPRLKQPV